MSNEHKILRDLIIGMRRTYKDGENMMAFARQQCNSDKSVNETIATLIAYDIQSGMYINNAMENPEFNRKWCEQLGEIIKFYSDSNSLILEVGCGEATTLSGVLEYIGDNYKKAYGFDISWSRLYKAQEWQEKYTNKADLFVSDLFEIPFEDNSIDIVYTSHSLEPNGGREEQAIKELLRVSRNKVVLVEPSYEFASPKAQKRMKSHGYVCGLKSTAQKLGATVIEHKLLDVSANILNPSGLIILKKNNSSKDKLQRNNSKNIWRCPLTNTYLVQHKDVYVSPETGIVYPVLRGIPMLRSQHAIVASKIINGI